MIEINLVPENLRKKRKGRKIGESDISTLPKETFIGVCGGFLGLLLIIHVMLQAVIFLKLASQTQYKKQWEEILPEKASVDKVLDELKKMRSKVKSIEEAIGSQRILWSKKLNEISDDMARGVWINKIELVEDTLLIQGSAVSKDNTEILNAHKFASNLKNDEEFKKYFSDIEIGIHSTTKLGIASVADFTVNATLE
jgi:Tfp pilus assembly protein PilN